MKRLSEADKRAWDSYRKTTDALDDALHRDPVVPVPSPRPVKVQQPVAPFIMGQLARPKASTHDLAPSVRDAIKGQAIAMDRRAFNRLKAGKLRPEAKLDLHGMTLDVAHPELIDFVLGNHRRGKRLLLIVTGKGKRRDDGGPIPTRLGVLRHQVPQWLRMAPLAPMILQVSEAHQSHGGLGAYYVYLRRSR